MSAHALSYVRHLAALGLGIDDILVKLAIVRMPASRAHVRAVVLGTPKPKPIIRKIAP